MVNKTLGSIMRISRCCTAYRTHILEDSDIRPSDHFYISYACQFPGSSQEEFAKAICVDKTTAAHILRTLEDKGYIERRVSSKDGRRRLIYPTKKALAIYPIIHQAYGDFMKKVLSGLSSKDQEELFRLTAIVAKNAQEIFENDPEAST